MKIYRTLIAALCASFIAAVALAADASPVGTWKWTAMGRGGNGGVEQTLKLDLKDGVLTGTLLAFQTPRGEVPDTPIENASLKDGVVKFSISRHFGDRTFTTTYEGKLEGDTIKGSTERPDRDGGTQKQEWTATRAK